MCDTCSKGDARFCQKALQPSAVIIADAVADTYATPSCVVVVGDLALRFV
jgi:predicted HAD superfamily phosphohydrolase YqeG